MVDDSKCNQTVTVVQASEGGQEVHRLLVKSNGERMNSISIIMYRERERETDRQTDRQWRETDSVTK